MDDIWNFNVNINKILIYYKQIQFYYKQILFFFKHHTTLIKSCSYTIQFTTKVEQVSITQKRIISVTFGGTQQTFCAG